MVELCLFCSLGFLNQNSSIRMLVPASAYYSQGAMFRFVSDVMTGPFLLWLCIEEKFPTKTVMEEEMKRNTSGWKAPIMREVIRGKATLAETRSEFVQSASERQMPLIAGAVNIR